VEDPEPACRSQQPPQGLHGWHVCALVSLLAIQDDTSVYTNSAITGAHNLNTRCQPVSHSISGLARPMHTQVALLLSGVVADCAAKYDAKMMLLGNNTSADAKVALLLSSVVADCAAKYDEKHLVLPGNSTSTTIVFRLKSRVKRGNGVHRLTSTTGCMRQKEERCAQTQ